MSDFSPEYFEWNQDKLVLKLKSSYNNPLKVFPCDFEYLKINFKGVKLIDLGYNRITEIPSWFHEIDTLEEVDLGVNKIKSIENLDKCLNLKKLDFGGNIRIDIGEIPTLITRLYELKLTGRKSSYKNIRAISNAINLKKLELNSIDFYIQNIKNLVNLKSLYIKLSGKSDKIHSIGELLNLETLFLSKAEYGEQIQEETSIKIANEVSKIKSIKFLYIKGEVAAHVDYSNMSNLINVFLLESEMPKFPISLFKKETIIKLVINQAQFNSIPDGLSSLKSLRILDLSENKKLEELPKDILDLEHLSELNIVSTAIKNIPTQLALMPNIQKLNYTSEKFVEESLFRQYDLIGVYKHLTKQEDGLRTSILEIPEMLRGPLQEYLVYFDEYYEVISGNKITFRVSKHDIGLKIEIEEINENDATSIQKAFTDYTQYLLSKKFNDIDNNIEVDKLVQDIKFLKLTVENNVNHFEQRVKILETQNEMLISQREFYQKMLINFSNKDIVMSISQDAKNITTQDFDFVNDNKVDISVSIDSKPFHEISKILEKYSEDENLNEDIANINKAITEKKRGGIASAVSNFFNKTGNVVDKAHLALVDAPEVIEKLKLALIAAKASLQLHHYKELAILADKLIHML